MKGWATDDLAAYFERQCNRHVNGGCTTLRCVNRGRMLNPGSAPMLSLGQLAICEEHQAAAIIRDLMERLERQKAPPNP
jgi:hypothetical protein